MAKVAVPDPLTSNYFPLGKGPKNIQVDATMKRKTPSELRVNFCTLFWISLLMIFVSSSDCALCLTHLNIVIKIFFFLIWKHTFEV